MILFEIIIGALLAGSLLFLIRRSPKHELRFWAMALVIAAAIYVGFAWYAHNWEWLPIEVASVGLYTIPAILALRYSHWWLVLGWVAHVAWDLGMHSGGFPGFVPHWYPGVCIGFDLCVAGYWIWRGKENANASSNANAKVPRSAEAL